MTTRPDVIIIMTDEERAAPSYESAELTDWRSTLNGSRWFSEHAVSFNRHYTGSLACVPSRPTLFTGQYPDVHGVTQTDGLGKMADDSRMRWLREGEVPTLGHWFRAVGYDTHYDGKWHITHADLLDDNGEPLPTNTAEGEILHDNVDRYLNANPLDPFGFSGWVGPEPHGGLFANCGLARDPLIAARVVRWLNDRYERRRNGDADALKPFLVKSTMGPKKFAMVRCTNDDGVGGCVVGDCSSHEVDRLVYRFVESVVQISVFLKVLLVDRSNETIRPITRWVGGAIRDLCCRFVTQIFEIRR